MANIANTEYRITGSRKALNDLWSTFLKTGTRTLWYISSMTTSMKTNTLVFTLTSSLSIKQKKIKEEKQWRQI